MKLTIVAYAPRAPARTDLSLLYILGRVCDGALLEPRVYLALDPPKAVRPDPSNLPERTFFAFPAGNAA